MAEPRNFVPRDYRLDNAIASPSGDDFSQESINQEVHASRYETIFMDIKVYFA